MNGLIDKSIQCNTCKSYNISQQNGSLPFLEICLQNDMYYLQLLSCFAWTKTSFHVVPNWSTTVQASGHTFQDKSHMFLPLGSLSTHKVVFPPAAKGTIVYQSIMIYNHDANTPLRYQFDLQINRRFILSCFYKAVPLVGYEVDSTLTQQRCL